MGGWDGKELAYEPMQRLLGFDPEFKPKELPGTGQLSKGL